MTGRTMFSIFLVVVVFGILFIRGINTGLQRIENDKDTCSDHNMSSIRIDRSLIVFCVDDKGQVFYLRNKDIE